MSARTIRTLVLAAAVAWSAGAAAATDPGKKACIVDARRLCPAAMNSMSRKKVEACMIAHVEQTSPACHDAMQRIKTEREGAGAH